MKSGLRIYGPTTHLQSMPFYSTPQFALRVCSHSLSPRRCLWVHQVRWMNESINAVPPSDNKWVYLHVESSAHHTLGECLYMRMNVKGVLQAHYEHLEGWRWWWEYYGASLNVHVRYYSNCTSQAGFGGWIGVQLLNVLYWSDVLLAIQ